MIIHKHPDWNTINGIPTLVDNEVKGYVIDVVEGLTVWSTTLLDLNMCLMLFPHVLLEGSF